MFRCLTAQVVSIPICLLWRVNIRPSQKLGLACFLCLSIVMAVISIVRVCGLVVMTPTGVPAFDTSWQTLWQQTASSIAVCLVSLTAFRQLFISHGPKRQRSPSKFWYSSTIEKLKVHKRKAEDEGFGQLPTIPSATLSGVRTLIQGGQRTRSAGDFDEEEMLAGWGDWPCQVLVTNHIRTEVCEVRLIS
jgi:hypothetical protein